MPRDPAARVPCPARASLLLLLIVLAGTWSPGVLAQERKEQAANELLRRLVIGARRCDIEHYDLQVDVPLPGAESSAEEEPAADIRAHIRVAGVLKEPVTAVQFLILNVARIRATGVGGVECPFTLRSVLPEFPVTLIEIALPTPLARGEKTTITIDYLLPSRHRGPDGRAVRRSTDPWFGPDEVHTNLASVWYPGNLYETHTMEMTVTVPPGLRVVASGVPVSETAEPDGRATFRFREDEGMNVMTVVAAPFRVHTIRRDGRDLVLYSLPLPHELDPERILDDLAFCLDYFEKKFGPCGLSRFAVVVAPPSYSAASYNARHYALVQDFLFSFHGLPPDAGGAVWFSVLAHEAAHVWWGHRARSDLLGNGGNWLREGLAEYSSWQALTARYGERLPPHYSHRKMLRDYQDSIRLLGDKEPSLLDITYAMPIDTSYEKGAWLYAMLERLMGADPFARTLARYLEAASARMANWKQFQKIAAEESPVDLEPFFTHWLVRTGRLDLAADAREDAEGRWSVLVTQSGDFPSGSSPAFRVLAEGADGSPREWTVRLPGEGKTLELPVEFRPRCVRVDPDCFLLDCARRNNRWPATWDPGIRAGFMPAERVARALGVPGDRGALFVQRTIPGSPADRAGLEGTCITSVAGRPVRDPHAIEWATWDLGRGMPLELVVRTPMGSSRVLLRDVEPVDQ